MSKCVYVILKRSNTKISLILLLHLINILCEKHGRSDMTFMGGDQMMDIHGVCIYLCCSKYWANWICRALPDIVMMRSVEPWAGSSIVMNAFDSIRIRRMRVPALPIIAPANCSNQNQFTHFTFNLISFYTKENLMTISAAHLHLLGL